ncbi:MAG: hypothetical protein ABIC82_00580 [bacterium]
MNYQGVIIEESLGNKDILKELKIVDTKIEQVAERHQTPRLKQWTLHTVEITENQAKEIAEKLAKVILDLWYADYKNESAHYIIFKNKIFCIDREDREQYKKAKFYGMAQGIPEYQVDFK